MKKIIFFVTLIVVFFYFAGVREDYASMQPTSFVSESTITTESRPAIVIPDRDGKVRIGVPKLSQYKEQPNITEIWEKDGDTFVPCHSAYTQDSTTSVYYSLSFSFLFYKDRVVRFDRKDLVGGKLYRLEPNSYDNGLWNMRYFLGQPNYEPYYIYFYLMPSDAGTVVWRYWKMTNFVKASGLSLLIMIVFILIHYRKRNLNTGIWDLTAVNNNIMFKKYFRYVSDTDIRVKGTGQRLSLMSLTSGEQRFAIDLLGQFFVKLGIGEDFFQPLKVSAEVLTDVSQIKD